MTLALQHIHLKKVLHRYVYDSCIKFFVVILFRNFSNISLARLSVSSHLFRNVMVSYDLESHTVNPLQGAGSRFPKTLVGTQKLYSFYI